MCSFIGDFVGSDRLQTNDFRNALSQAKELALNISGGEFTVEEQDNVIRMLEALRDKKRYAKALPAIPVAHTTFAELGCFNSLREM